MIRTLAAAFATTTCIVALATPAAAQTRQFNIPAGSLRSALDAFARQSGRQVIYRGDEVRSARSPGVRGARTAEEALDALLVDTGFTARKDASGAFAVAKLGNAPAAAETATSSGDDAASDGFVGDIVVTAQKREERQLDVPIPVAVLTAPALAQTNQTRVQEYFSRIPGLNVSPSIQAAQLLSIRGVSTGTGNPTVGIVIDDVPYGGSTGLGSGNMIPDLDPSDLARIEVLRGPQGTIYGASSLGGLFKYVTVDPSVDGVSGSISAGVNSVRHGDAGYSLRGAINVPVGDTLAIRASGFTRRDPGYIDNVQTGQDDINRVDTYGGRLSALWRPVESVSLKLSALYQNLDADGVADIFPTLGELRQNYLIGTGPYKVENQAYSAVLKVEGDGITLTSLTGYNINNIADSLDYTAALGALTPGQFGEASTADQYFETQRAEKFSEELRAQVSLGNSVDWLIGAFYTTEDTERVQNIFAFNPSSQVITGQFLNNQFGTRYREYAAFTDLTFRLGERFDIQIGARESAIRQTYSSIRTGPFVTVIQGVASPFIVPERTSSSSAFNYLVTPRFHITPDVMLYARFASGYRPGGPNSTASLPAGVPAEYNPDTTRNYELGFKGSLLDRLLTVDASVYYIDWRNIQIELRSAAGSYFDNGGSAKSAGAELSFELRPVRGTTIAAWGVYNDAVLTEALPATSTAFGQSGDRLPFSSRYSANTSIDQRIGLGADANLTLGGSLSYVGRRYSIFRGLSAGVPLPRQAFPAYTKIDLRAAFEIGPWNATFFVNNLTDRRGVLGGGLGAFNPLAFNYIQPRTIGLTLGRTF